jgi:hypothetical protein
LLLAISAIKEEQRLNHMTIGTGHQGGPADTIEVAGSPLAVHPVVATAQKKRHHTAKPSHGPREDIADLKSEVERLRREVHGLRSRLHGELAVLALRIEDNDRVAMQRRKVVRWWLMAAVLVVWFWQAPAAVLGLLNGPFLMPGLLLFAVTTAGGLALLLLMLHNGADEEDQQQRYQNWFRLTAPDER